MKKLLLIVLAVNLTYAVTAQQNYWTYHSSTAPIAKDRGATRATFPTEFKLFDLNISALRQQLFSIVDNSSLKSVIIRLPNADGQVEDFEVNEASNFEPALQARFPEIRAYSGKGITDRFATLKLSISPQGIQTMVFRVPC